MDNFEVRELVNLRHKVHNHIELLKALQKSDADIQECLERVQIETPYVKYADTRIPHLEEYYKQLTHQILSNCAHEFVIDSIDITPDKSRTICYCDVCGFSP